MLPITAGRLSTHRGWRVDNQGQAMQMIDQALRPETNKNMLQAPFIESRDTACPAVAARRSGVQFAADNPDYVRSENSGLFTPGSSRSGRYDASRLGLQHLMDMQPTFSGRMSINVPYTSQAQVRRFNMIYRSSTNLLFFLPDCTLH